LGVPSVRVSPPPVSKPGAARLIGTVAKKSADKPKGAKRRAELLYTSPMPTTVRIKPELITERRLRIEMYGLEDEDIENTIRMKGWAWVLARKSWAYAGEPDFIFRQIREVVIALPDITFQEDSIEESIRTVKEKARSDEEREEGRELLRRAFEKSGQLDKAERYL